MFIVTVPSIRALVRRRSAGIIARFPLLVSPAAQTVHRDFNFFPGNIARRHDLSAKLSSFRPFPVDS
jgi:hypothetical protein